MKKIEVRILREAYVGSIYFPLAGEDVTAKKEFTTKWQARDWCKEAEEQLKKLGMVFETTGNVTKCVEYCQIPTDYQNVLYPRGFKILIEKTEHYIPDNPLYTGTKTISFITKEEYDELKASGKIAA